MAPKTWTFVCKKNTRNELTKCSDRSYMSNHWTTLCKGHLVGKQKRSWLSTKGATWHTTSKVVNFNICEPMQAKLIGGAKHFALFIDEFFKLQNNVFF